MLEQAAENASQPEPQLRQNAAPAGYEIGTKHRLAAVLLSIAARIGFFAAALNQHVHLHACVTDGVFERVAAADDVRFHAARPLSPADLATVTQRVRRRLVRWFCRKGFLSHEAAADMLAWQHSGFSVDASVRISPSDRDVPAYFRSLEHLLRYCARPAFALERLSVVPGADDRPERVRYALPRHKRAAWVGPGRTRKSTRPGTSGVVDLSPFEFLDRLAALIPPPRKHRHRYNGVFAPNHPLRPAVTAIRSATAPSPLSLWERAGVRVPRTVLQWYAGPLSANRSQTTSLHLARTTLHGSPGRS